MFTPELNFAAYTALVTAWFVFRGHKDDRSMAPFLFGIFCGLVVTLPVTLSFL